MDHLPIAKTSHFSAKMAISKTGVSPVSHPHVLPDVLLGNPCGENKTMSISCGFDDVLFPNHVMWGCFRNKVSSPFECFHLIWLGLAQLGFRKLEEEEVGDEKSSQRKRWVN